MIRRFSHFPAMKVDAATCLQLTGGKVHLTEQGPLCLTILDCEVLSLPGLHRA